MKTKSLVTVAFFVAFICILAPFSLYVGTIPITLGLFAVCLSSALLGGKKGVIAVLIYLLIGAIGVPVFAGFLGGVQVLFRHTGGYLWGYIPCALVVGFGCERFSFRGHIPLFVTLGVVMCNLLGTIWYMTYMNLSFFYAFEITSVSFILTDIVKIVACSVLIPILKKTCRKFL